MELNARIYVDEDDLNAAIGILDDHFIDNDLDEGNRIMVNEDDVDDAVMFLEEDGIDCDII